MQPGNLISSGSQMTVQGRTLTFVTAPTGAANEVVYSISDSATQVAVRTRAALQALGFTAAFPTIPPAAPGAPNPILNISGGTPAVSAAGTHAMIGVVGSPATS